MMVTTSAPLQTCGELIFGITLNLFLNTVSPFARHYLAGRDPRGQGKNHARDRHGVRGRGNLFLQ